jgi:hypothetical protein
MTNAPTFGIVVQAKGDEKTANGKPKLMMCLQLMTDVSQAMYYLCDVEDNFQNIAQQFSDMIVKAGQEGRRAQSGLLVVEGVIPDGYRKEGREPGGPRSAG